LQPLQFNVSIGPYIQSIILFVF